MPYDFWPLTVYAYRACAKDGGDKYIEWSTKSTPYLILLDRLARKSRNRKGRPMTEFLDKQPNPYHTIRIEILDERVCYGYKQAKEFCREVATDDDITYPTSGYGT